MIKQLVYAVECDYRNKLVALSSCSSCQFWGGKRKDIMQCDYDAVAHKKNIREQFKNYPEYTYLEFGEKE